MIDLGTMHQTLDALPKTNASAITVYGIASDLMKWVNAQTASNSWTDIFNFHTAFDDSTNIKKLNAQVSAIGDEVGAIESDDNSFSDYDVLLALAYQCAIEANAVEEGTGARADNLNKLWADIKSNAGQVVPTVTNYAVLFVAIAIVAVIGFEVYK